MNISEEILAKANVWLEGNYDEETKSTIKEMINNSPEELTESFYQTLEFGTGGLRGIMGVGTNRMNIYTVGMATQGLSNYLKSIYPNEEIKVAVSYDNRNNSTLFAKTTADVFAANGFTVYLFDALRPTPELSFAIRQLGCKSGVMITASHNPKEYNGYKAFWSDGGQVVAPHDTNIITEVNKIASVDDVAWTGGEANIVMIGEDIDKIYMEKIKGAALSPEAAAQFSDMKIVYTPVHGTGVNLVPMSLRNYGFNNILLVEEQTVIDGNFPTVSHPNPEDAATLKMAIELAEKEGAEVLLATDPDADRIAVGIRDDKGEVYLVNGNQTTVLFTYYILERMKELGTLTDTDFCVKTIVTTKMMNDVASSYGIKCYDCLTGFKYIAAIIKANEGKAKYICGGEESYGFLIGDYVRDKDAVTACAIFAEMAAWCKSKGSSIYEMLMELYAKFGFYQDGLRNVVRKGISGATEIKEMMANYRANPPKEIAGVKVVEVYDYVASTITNTETGATSIIDMEKSNVLQFLLEDGSMVSVRPSGTEPKIKFYYGVKYPFAKGDSYTEVKAKAVEKIAEFEKSLGLI